ncbi:zinc finger CCCH domain-containing protein 39-like [Wolffia australiana]
MGTAETPPPFFPLLSPPGLNSEGGFWPGARPLEESDGPQFKRHRSSEDVQVLTDPNRPLWQHNGPGILSSAPPPPQNPPAPAMKGSKIFFKTRLCMKFKSGSCPYGQNCSFAHGPEELRRPPPNWPSLAAGLDDDRAAGNRSNKLKICRKFYNGEECPYGERCTFAHVEPGTMRESSAISVGLTETAAVTAAQDPDAAAGGDSSGLLHRSSALWKPKPSDLRKYGGPAEADAGAAAAPPRRLGSPSDGGGPASNPRGFLRLRGLRKITNIYADWIDD